MPTPPPATALLRGPEDDASAAAGLSELTMAPAAVLGGAVPDGAIGTKRKAVDASVMVKPAAGRPPVQRGRSFLNHQQRLEIIKKKDDEPKWTQVQLARWAAVHFGLPKEPSQATIAVLLKKRDQLKAATVRPQTRTIRSPRHPELEAALLLWVRHLQHKRVPFTGENIRLKAAALAAQLGLTTTLNFSTGWMSGFVTRHNLLLARAHKKKPSDLDDEPLRAIVKSYEPHNMFALHETSLVYNDLPYDHTQRDQADPEQDRLCVGLAVNADGSEKLEPFVVTTCRRKFGVLTETFFNVDGNMTARIFEQWLYKLNQRMVATHRKIAVLVNSAPSHFPLQLSNVRLVVLQTATALRAHPLETTVTKTFKALYRKTHLSFAVDQAEEGRARIFDVSLTRALVWIKQAWLDVPSEMVRMCWARTGLHATRADQTLTTETTDPPPEIIQALLTGLSQLQLLEAMPIQTLLEPASESDAHYHYDDATVVRVVAGDADDDHEADEDDEQATTTGVDRSRASSAAALASHLPPDTHVFEREPTTEELLSNYRGVIWSLDAEAERSNDLQTALRFLRQKQQTLRLQHQREQELQLATTTTSSADEPSVATGGSHPTPPSEPAPESLVL